MRSVVRKSDDAVCNTRLFFFGFRTNDFLYFILAFIQFEWRPKKCESTGSNEASITMNKPKESFAIFHRIDDISFAFRIISFAWRMTELADVLLHWFRFKSWVFFLKSNFNRFIHSSTFRFFLFFSIWMFSPILRKCSMDKLFLPMNFVYKKFFLKNSAFKKFFFKTNCEIKTNSF